MNFYTALSISLLSAFCLSGQSAGSAETTETTQTTTTVTTGTNSTVLTLPSSGSYVVVDPITGQIQGNYDPAARLVDGTALRSGVVIVNQANGGPIGFVDSSGNIVDMSVV